MRTPAFVPLATKATVKGLLPEEVAALGYEMVLGNTFHLLLNPGPELIERFGGVGAFMGWAGRDHRLGGLPGLLDGSRHGRGRDQGLAPAAAPERTGAILSIEEEGVRFRSYVDGRERFLSPEGSMEVQAALRSDIALGVRRVHPVPRGSRIHRALDRAYPSLAGSLPELARRARPRRSSWCTGSCRAASTRTCAAPPRARSPRAAATAWRSAARWGPTRSRCTRWSATPPRELGGAHEALPRHLLGIGEVDDLIAGVELGIDTFDCAMPTRLGRHGTALVPDPANRWRLDLHKGRWRDSAEPLLEGCPCPACARGLSRAYLSYLARAGELTGMRLLTLHNLTFLARLMADLRGAILAGRLPEVAAALRAGAAPGARRASSRLLLMFSLTSCRSAAEVCSTSW